MSVKENEKKIYGEKENDDDDGIAAIRVKPLLNCCCFCCYCENEQRPFGVRGAKKI